MLSNGMQTIHEQRQKIKNGLFAGMIPMALRSLKWEQTMAEATQKAAHKATFSEGVDMPDEGDDTVNVDSPQTVNNYYTHDGSASQQQPKSSLLATAAKLALGAGLIGTGAGAGVGIPLLIDAWKNKPDVVVPDQDQGVKYFLDLGKPTAE